MKPGNKSQFGKTEKHALSEEQMHQALNAGNIGTWVLELENGMITASVHFTKVFNLPRDTTFSYQDMLQAIHPEEQRIVDAAIQKAIQTRGDLDVEFSVLDQDAEKQWLQLRGNPELGQDGEPHRIAGLLFNITERKVAECKLLDAKAEAENERTRLEEVFRQAPTFMCILSGPDHVFERANEYYLKLVGRRDILHKTVKDALPEVERQGFIDLLNRVYQTGEPFHATDQQIVLEHPNRDGQSADERFLNFVYQPIRGTDGSITGIFVQGIDITERKKAELELVKVSEKSELQKRLYETVISSTPDLVYVFDLDYRFKFVNDALLQMWGRTLEESMGKRLLDVGYEPWHAEMHEREIDKVVATKKPIRGEVPFTHATLGQRSYDYIFVPVFNAEGKVESVAGTTRDITERKKAEETQRLLLGELNHRVKNTLATIQSIASQTLSTADNPSAFVDTFNGRLHALARSHSLLTKSNWEGAYIEEIFRKQIMDEAATDRVSLLGPEVFVSSQAALHLALVVFELGTNAHKYGALSSAHGKLNISWEVQSHDSQPMLTLNWVEEDGPNVAEPKSLGFGMKLIEQSLKSVGGQTTLTFNSSGLQCTINLPLPEIQENSNTLEAAS